MVDRLVAVYENKRYKAYINRVAGEIGKITLFFNCKEVDINGIVSAYGKDLYEKEVKKEEVSELYREYFMARYKEYEFYVILLFRDNNEIEIVTADSTIGRACNLEIQDRDLYTKRLGSEDEYQLIHVREDLVTKNTIRREVTLEECFKIETELFE